MQSYPCKNKNFTGNAEELAKILGVDKETKSHLHWQYPRIWKFCEDLSWNLSTSTPHRSETNGIVERAVPRIKEETSAILLQSRLVDKKGSTWLLTRSRSDFRVRLSSPDATKRCRALKPSRPKRRRDDYEWIDDEDGALENPKNE